MDELIGIIIAILAALLIGFAGGWSSHNYLLIMDTAEYQYQRGLEAGTQVSVEQVREICGGVDNN